MIGMKLDGIEQKLHGKKINGDSQIKYVSQEFLP